MSLDFYLMDDYCQVCKRGDYVVSKNITHNLGAMWREAGVYSALYESEGKQACEVSGVLRVGLKLMCSDSERFKAFDAPNGWGIYEHAVPWLREVLEACELHPTAIVHISR